MSIRASSEFSGFVLNPYELLNLRAVLSGIERFPPALLALSRFPAEDLEAAFVQDGAISPEQLVVGAYFGYVPLPANYMKFVDHAERVNRQRENTKEAAELKGESNCIAREGEAARELGYLDRRAIQQAYRDMDKHAKEHGFESFKSIIDWPKAHLERNSIFSAEERKAFASGPLFLYDLAHGARGARLPNVVFAAHDGWVLLAHAENKVASLHAFNGSDLWRMGFAPQKVIRCSPESLDGLPPLMPEAVYDALLRLHLRHFPDCESDLVFPESSAYVEFDLRS